ncbi:MAG: phosphoglycerate dehydrogenase [Magnetococcus sp. YQC-9]
MNRVDKVAVCSRSFSRHPILRAELLARYEQVTFNDSGRQMEGEALIAFLSGHDKAITALERINDSVLSRLPALRVVSKYGVGLDMIDMEAMRQYGKHLGWTSGVNRRSVSELVIAFAVTLLRYVPAAQREVLSGTWRQHVGGLLSGRTVGIIGCGHIGKDLVELLQPWGCRLLANDILDFPEFYDRFKVEPVALETLLADSDIITLHVPLDDSTRNMLSAERLRRMKPSAILINAARGGLVDELELKIMLREKSLAAAAFDVFAIEPPEDIELLNLPNFLVTPHIGGSAEEAILAMGRAAIHGLDEHALPMNAAAGAASETR